MVLSPTPTRVGAHGFALASAISVFLSLNIIKDVLLRTSSGFTSVSSIALYKTTTHLHGSP